MIKGGEDYNTLNAFTISLSYGFGSDNDSNDANGE
jgi:hypothetical protein